MPVDHDSGQDHPLRGEDAPPPRRPHSPSRPRGTEPWGIEQVEGTIMIISDDVIPPTRSARRRAFVVAVGALLLAATGAWRPVDWLRSLAYPIGVGRSTWSTSLNLAFASAVCALGAQCRGSVQERTVGGQQH
jgi:hypothetical protein